MLPGGVISSLALALICKSTFVASVPTSDLNFLQHPRQLKRSPIREWHSPYKSLFEAHGRGKQLETLKTVSYAHDDYLLSPDFEITSVPTHRYYYFDIAEAETAPDGVTRTMFLVNGRVNAEVIEANVGDTVTIRVKNWLKMGTSIHVHGIPHNESIWQDGPVGVVTCPIPASGTFDIVFKIERKDECGTYWYHAHRGGQYGDGIRGPFITHCPNDALKRGESYDYDQVVVLTDHFHDLSEAIVKQLRTPAGYLGNTSAPTPESGLILGRGKFDCSKARPGFSCKAQNEYGEVVLAPKARTRLRVINTSIHGAFHFSVDEHDLSLIEVDDTALVPSYLQRIPINGGQRFSAVIDTRKNKPGTSFWMRSRFASVCFRGPLRDVTMETVGIVRIGKSAKGDPTSKPFEYPEIEGCEDPPREMLVPRVQVDAPKEVDQVDEFNTTFMVTIDGPRFFQNNISYPMLFRAMRGEDLEGHLSTVIYSNTTGTGGRFRVHDVLLNNPGAGSHPIHFHGVKVFIVGRGNGTLSKKTWESGSIEPWTSNPIRRDTWLLPPNSWAVVRFIADLPGVHAVHCHIALHAAVGMAGVLVIRPDMLRHLVVPDSSIQLCAMRDNGLGAMTPEPGR